MSHSHRRTTRHLAHALPLLGLIVLASRAMAGDPLGVNETLAALHGNWPQAEFSIDVTGISDDAAVTDHSLQVEYEAASKGYLAYVRVSSHGDILATAVPAADSSTGTLPFAVEPPLGHERAIFLFSDRPLAPLLGATDSGTSLGSDRWHAASLVRRITRLESRGLRVATRRMDYLVEAPPGQTQYTTRGIIRAIAASSSPEGSSQPPPRFPTRIEFEFNSDRLTQASQRDLDVFGEAIIETLPQRRVKLEGHTDAIGADWYNMKLSMRRADAARRYLLESFGLPPQEVEAMGKGKADPIAPNSTPAGRSQNRRVDFIFEDAAAKDP